MSCENCDDLQESVRWNQLLLTQAHNDLFEKDQEIEKLKQNQCDPWQKE